MHSFVMKQFVLFSCTRFQSWQHFRSCAFHWCLCLRVCETFVVIQWVFAVQSAVHVGVLVGVIVGVSLGALAIGVTVLIRRAKAKAKARGHKGKASAVHPA